MSDYNWNDHGSTLQQTIEKHAEAEDLNRRAEQIYRERDQLISELEKLIKSSRDLLKGVFKKNPKKLGEWGFEVNDTPRPPKAE
ncbi:MAG: hypothetical protein IPJ74_14640 [Saprospiraceae bacterium]|nr:hypothetical protein [Saprospiraceae bacterium]